MDNLYKIDINKNYTDIFLLINTKEKLQDFFNYLIVYIVKETREKLEEKKEDYFPVAIKNKKAKVIEMDYNIVVKAFAYWTKEVLNFSQWEDIIKNFSYNFLSDKAKKTNESIFLTSFVFGMFHRSTSIGFNIRFGVTGYQHLNSIPVIYRSKETQELMQYAIVSFYTKKINDAIKDNAMKADFESILECSCEDFEQIAFGLKPCKDEWGAENQNHYSA